MSDKNNFKRLLEEEEMKFESSDLRDKIDRNLNQRFAFIRLLGDLTELFTARMIDVIVMMSDENVQPTGDYFTPALKTDLDAALDNLIDRDVSLAVQKLKALIDEQSAKYQTVLAFETYLQSNSGNTYDNPGNYDDDFIQRVKDFIRSLRKSDLK